MQTCIRSVLALDSKDSLRALGDIDSLRHSLALLCPLLQRGPGNAREAELLRYSMALTTLGKRLLKNASATRRVQEGVEQAQRQIAHFADPMQRTLPGSPRRTPRPSAFSARASSSAERAVS
ncbi:hypothetical protein GGI1_10028 [Acidithiobacillus sp. GGI-221]|nr:hypothetical protein GGI1_10028 [Acidithiobacillus sp. GGI-221]